MGNEDILNIIAEIKKLNDEISILKEENKYLRRKAEIAPLVAIYRHFQDQEIVITKKDNEILEYGKRNVPIMVRNDELQISTETRGLEKLCDIDDIAVVELNDIEYDLEINNETN